MKNSLHHLLFETLPEPVCLLSKELKIQDCNEAFQNLIGYKKTEIKKKKISLDSIAYKRDLKNLLKRIDKIRGNLYLRDELRLMAKDKNIKEVEVSIKALLYDEREYLVCVMHDIAGYKELERELREKGKKEHYKILEMASSILQIKQLLEKLHRLPVLFRELWKCDTKDELLKKTVELLAHSGGMKYEMVSLFLLEGEYLQLAFSNTSCSLKQFNIKKQHRFALVARGENKIISDEAGEYVLPILSPEKIEGIIQVRFEKSEKELIKKNEYIKIAHLNLLETFCEFLGFFLYHLVIRNQKQQTEKIDRDTGVYNQNYFQLKVDECTQKNIPFFVITLSTLKHFEKELLEIIEQCKPKDTFLGKTGERNLSVFYKGNNAELVKKWARKLKDQLDKSLIRFKYICSIIKMKKGRDFFKLHESCLETAKGKFDNELFYWDFRKKKAIKISTKRVRTKLS